VTDRLEAAYEAVRLAELGKRGADEYARIAAEDLDRARQALELAIKQAPNRVPAAMRKRIFKQLQDVPSLPTPAPDSKDIAEFSDVGWVDMRKSPAPQELPELPNEFSVWGFGDVYPKEEIEKAWALVSQMLRESLHREADLQAERNQLTADLANLQDQWHSILVERDRLKTALVAVRDEERSRLSLRMEAKIDAALSSAPPAPSAT
jgi:hypothetical protein